MRVIYSVSDYLDSTDTGDKTLRRLWLDARTANGLAGLSFLSFRRVMDLIGYNYKVSVRKFRKKPYHSHDSFFAYREIVKLCLQVPDSTYFFDSTTFSFETNPRRSWQSARNVTSFFSSTNYRRYHLLMIVNNQRVFAWQIVLGRVASTGIAAFLCEVVKKIRLEREQGVTHIILDNAKVHKTLLMKNLAEKSGLVFLFTSSHSPYMNPIEEVFRFLKGSFRNLHAINESTKKIQGCHFRSQQNSQNWKASDGFVHQGYRPSL